MHPYSNRLIHESSPYLLQHAHNPVDWYPYSEEAFQKAKEENKPVLVSIGYAACHWCHVMERESFENEQVAAIMNENFINIKVDREERPDVDHIYMDAVQAISGSGGWPLNVFLTPEKKPFYGGTYFPPQRAFNRASWTEVLLSVAEAFKEKKEELETQANNLTEHLKSSNLFGTEKNKSRGDFTKNSIEDVLQNILRTADTEWGGFGKAPKFPQTFTISFLLQYHQLIEKKKDKGEGTNEYPALQQALLSLDKMAMGGIYDQVGGGFARYSTDTEWLVPHFEKMLYDNALLVTTYADAYKLTGNPFYKQIIEETLGFVERELMHGLGGFYSALDADSEGEEGKFYTWTYEEVKEVLKEDSALFCVFYDIKPGGNWEGKSIPWIKVPIAEYASQQGIDSNDLQGVIARSKSKLLRERAKRPRPLLDDKVLLGWNALMNIAYTRAYAATGILHYCSVAEKNMEFLLRAFRADTGGFYHTWKDNTARIPAFLDDYANLVAALLELGQVTSNFHWFDIARDITEWVTRYFSDENSKFFYFTSQLQQDVLVRKNEVYDGATPSGNSVMAQNLYKLSIIYDRGDW
ncbi:MAG TPA: thioredoxin domain-containing protein, partial [Flavisolibacter sp.]|nr:thioredoxin domain-containing protein [Flavisolibacter sp.]